MPSAAVDDPLGEVVGESGLDPGEATVLDAEVDGLGLVRAGQDCRDVGDDQVQLAHGVSSVGSVRVEGREYAGQVAGGGKVVHGPAHGVGCVRMEPAGDVVGELGGQLVVGQRAARPATVDQHLLDQLLTGCGPQGDHGRELVGVDRVAPWVGHHVDPRHQRPAQRVAREVVGEVVEAQAEARAAEQAGDHGVRPAELGLVARLRRTLDLDRLTDGADHRARDADRDRGDLLGPDSRARNARPASIAAWVKWLAG